MRAVKGGSIFGKEPWSILAFSPTTGDPLLVAIQQGMLTARIGRRHIEFVRYRFADLNIHDQAGKTSIGIRGCVRNCTALRVARTSRHVLAVAARLSIYIFAFDPADQRRSSCFGVAQPDDNNQAESSRGLSLSRGCSYDRVFVAWMAGTAPFRCTALN